MKSALSERSSRFSGRSGSYRFWRRGALAPCVIFVALASRASEARAELDIRTLDVPAIVTELQLRETPEALRQTPGWRPPRKIVINVAHKPDRLQWFSEVVKGTTLIPVNSESEAAAILKSNRDIDALVGFQCGESSHPNPAAVDLIKKAVASNSVRWIQIGAAGVEGCAALPEARKSKIMFTNMQGAQSIAVAEHTFALILYLTRQMDATRDQQKNEIWKTPAGLKELHGKTMLILGLGGNGIEIASRAHAFGMKIIATRNTVRDHPDYVEYVGGPAETNTLASQADIIVSTLPLTLETTHIFDAEFFSKLKAEAYFINVGRGESVVSQDLIAALNKQQFAGAGLDVTDPEPLPHDHPLWKTPNVIISPHDATPSDMADDRRQNLMREQLRRFAAGDKMLMVVDLKRGY